MPLMMTKDYFSSAIYLLTEFKVIVFYYMKMFFFPFNQNVDPDFPLATGLTDLSVLSGLLLIALFLTGGLYFQKKNPLITYGIFWFYITLLPTSSIIPLLDTAAEHRVYLPYIGIILIVSVSLNNFFRKYNKSLRFHREICLVSIFLSLLLFSSLTIQRNFIWKDEVSLWNDAAKKSPWKPRPFNNAGEAYEKESNYQLAVENLKKAISLAPDYDYARNNLGTVYGKLNQLDLAIKEYKHVLKVNDHFPTAHFNLGKVYEIKGVPDEAIKEYYLAIKKQHDFYQAYFNLANIYSRRKEYQKAIETYEEFLKYKPSMPVAYLELGKVLIKTEKVDEAFKYFSKAAELDSNYVPAKVAIGNIFMMKGNFKKAEEIYQQVLRIDPKNFTVYNNLGLIYLQQEKNRGQALYHFKKSLEINPSQPEAKSIMDRIKNIQNN
jgi:tetratricopeptide (TPR) repeat protein